MIATTFYAEPKLSHSAKKLVTLVNSVRDTMNQLFLELHRGTNPKKQVILLGRVILRSYIHQKTVVI